MKIVIMGAGALGCIYGGYLARAGHEVTLVGRPAAVQIIQNQGLHISGVDEFVVQIDAVSDASSLREADLLLLCVRTTDTARALQDLKHLQPHLVASVQNGIHKEETLIAHYGPGPVLGAVSVIGARMIEPGHARCTMLGHTWFAEMDGVETPRLQGLVGVWRKAGLTVVISSHLQTTAWSKLAYLLPLSTLGGLTRLPYHLILQSPDLAYLFVQMVREVNKIAHAYGITLEDLPGMGVATLVQSSFDQGIRLLNERGKALQVAGQTDISANMQYDLVIGRPTEIEAIAGDVIRYAQDAGLSVPAISFVYRTIRGVDYWARN